VFCSKKTDSTEKCTGKFDLEKTSFLKISLFYKLYSRRLLNSTYVGSENFNLHYSGNYAAEIVLKFSEI
jgi:hypothetical protein